MTPFASVAMLEKLALLKIARCGAPALSSAASACLRKVPPAPLETPILVLVASLAMVLPPVTDARSRGTRLGLRGTAPPYPCITNLSWRPFDSEHRGNEPARPPAILPGLKSGPAGWVNANLKPSGTRSGRQ